MPEDRFCGNCGQELQPEDRFCANCGRPVQETAAVPTPEADVPVPPPPQAEDRSVPTQAPQTHPDLVAEERERLVALREARRQNFRAKRARSMTLLSFLVAFFGVVALTQGAWVGGALARVLGALGTIAFRARS